MNKGQLRARLRVKLDDVAVPQLWDDDTLDLYINEAEREVAFRARCLRDETTPAVCQVALVADQQRYVLDPRVFEVLHARINGQRYDLERNTSGSFRGYQNSGVACEYGIDREGATLVLTLNTPTPAANPDPTRIDMTVLRYPLNGMVDDADPAEVANEYQIPMLDWAVYLAFDTPNSDINGQNLKKKDDAEARFTARFGERVDANVERKRLRHRAPITVPDGVFRTSSLHRRGYHPTPNDPE